MAEDRRARARRTLPRPEIMAGRDTLVSAPTGSGKTLAAFLVSIDRLMRRAQEQGPLGETVDTVIARFKTAV